MATAPTPPGWAMQLSGRYERDAAGRPDHVLVQPWHDKPDHLLPETAQFTFTHFIDRYVADRRRLGLAAVESLQEKRE